MTDARASLHAGCVLLGETGVLILGPAGAGKSSLARALVGRWRARGLFAAIVADDRVRLHRAANRLTARPHPAIAGLMEVRGVGVVAEAGEPAALLRAVVELSEAEVDRMPSAASRTRAILGLELPGLLLDSRRSAEESAEIVAIWLDAASKS